MVLVALLPALLSARVPLRITEVARFLTGSVIVFVGLAELLLREGPMLDSLPGLLGAQYWMVGIVMILAFVMLGRRGGLLLGSAVWLASAAMTALGLVQQAAAGHRSGAIELALPRLQVILLVLLALVWVLAGMREQYHRASWCGPTCWPHGR